MQWTEHGHVKVQTLMDAARTVRTTTPLNQRCIWRKAPSSLHYDFSSPFPPTFSRSLQTRCFVVFPLLSWLSTATPSGALSARKKNHVGFSVDPTAIHSEGTTSFQCTAERGTRAAAIVSLESLERKSELCRMPCSWSWTGRPPQFRSVSDS